MDRDELIRSVINKNLNSDVLQISPVGKGASGSVFRVCLKDEPFKTAVKISEHKGLIKKEYDMLSFLKEKTNSKIPQTYFLDTESDLGIISMEFIEGTSGTDKSIPFITGKRHLSESIIDNLLVIQKATNNKFGPYDNAVYDTWQDYYKDFTESIYGFSLQKHSQGKLDDTVMKTVEIAYLNFDRIFSEEIRTPSLIHGDYWMPNFIIDKKNRELLCAVDPFNVMWADPEYELFCLTVGYGKLFHLYELYKEKVNVTKYCDVKLEMYALFSELLWYKNLGSISHKYLSERSKKLLKQINKHFKL